ncbi:hypothetical protein Ddc_21205 [Ditylenchus destructor]|nr:hypothetical protein Ddc_21205 [Ditylenchus destructor]
MGNAISMLLGWQEKLPRSKVEISDDCWLDVLKFLTCTQWSEKRYVSHQINGIAARNISRLPRAIIEMAIFGEEYFERKQLRELSDFTLMKLLNLHDEIIAFEGIIPQNKVKQWFVNRGITLEERVRYQPLPTQIPPVDILIEKSLFGNYYSDSTDICILGPAQNGTVQKSWFGYLFCTQELFESVVFHAQFRPYLKQSLFSWASLEQFLTFLFHPLSYIKKVEMFAVNQKFVDAVKEKFADSFTVQRNTTDAQKLDNNKPPYIHCETFILLYNLG